MQLHKELKKRQARASFLKYIEQISTEAAPARHHRLLIEKLEAVERGDIKRLMVFMPPGSAKSTYANVLFSSWYIGRNPGKKLITASYTQEVADKWGRRVRSIVRGEEYQNIFQTTLSPDSQAAGRWALTTDSEYYAVGVGGSVTSFRADLGIIDDPVKGREEADSETMRRKTIEWWVSDFWTRLKPGAAVVVIMTRWHEEDIAGWLLEEEKRGGEKWEVLSIPMEAKENDPLGRAPGEMLWPEWYTPDMVTIAKRNIRNWSSLYQQEPAPEDGDYFKREWIRWYDEEPKHLRKYGASDYAVTAGGGDFTIHLVAGVDPMDDIYLLDMWRGQTDSLEWVEAFIQFVLHHRPVEWAEEAGQIARSMGPLIDKRQRETKAYCYRKQFTSGSDKPTRAQAIRGRMQQGKVYFPRNAKWVADLIHEMMLFPNGKHDDQVDTLGLLGRMLAEMMTASVPKPQEERNGMSFNELRDAQARKRRGDLD